tara:strand:+ start:721 stop:906 length:186 start_codon:yes stop_codon:yes gene_type:complete
MPWTTISKTPKKFRFDLFGTIYKLEIRRSKEYYEPICDWDGTPMTTEEDFFRNRAKKRKDM